MPVPAIMFEHNLYKYGSCMTQICLWQLTDLLLITKCFVHIRINLLPLTTALSVVCKEDNNFFLCLVGFWFICCLDVGLKRKYDFSQITQSWEYFRKN